jgi:hypothetical protein
MADSSKSIQVNISVVVDQAKSALGDMASTVSKTTKTLEAMGTGAASGTDQIAQGMDKAKTSSNGFFDSTTTGVLKGIASYDLLRQSVTKVVDFLGDSIRESMQASATMALVENNVKNAGIAYDQISGKLKEYANAQIQMGFDDEATALSVSKLLLITHDYSQALALNQLAMDLSRSKGVDLGTATTLIAQVTQGNTRALREYGIGMTENATTADVLAEAHDKLKNAAVAYADSTAGKLDVVTQQWDNMKQEIGDSLQPKLDELFSSFENNLPFIEEFLKVLVGGLELVGEGVGLLLKPFEILGFAIGNVINLFTGVPLADFNSFIIGTGDSVTKLSTKTQEGDVNFQNYGKASKNAAKDLAQAKQDADNLAQALEKVINKQSEFAFSAQDDFSRFTATIANTGIATDKWIAQTTQGFDALSSKIKSTQGDIDSLEQKIAGMDTAFDAFKKSTTDSAGDTFAQIVFKAQQDVASLPQQIADAQAKGVDSSALQQQYSKAQAVLKTSLQEQYQSNAEYQSELSLLQNNAKTDELTASYNVMQKKIADKLHETLVEEAEINKQIEAAREKKTQLEAFEKSTTATFAEQVKKREASISTETGGLAVIQVAAQNAKVAYDALAASMAKTLSPTQSFTTQTSTASGVKGKAVGGPVNGGETYLVGENGPELFTPNVSGGITPNDKVSVAGGQIIININNPSVRSDNDITMITRDVMDALSRRDELARLGAYK